MEADEDSWELIIDQIDDLLIHKAEAIINSLTKEEKDALEEAGFELSMEEVHDLILEKLEDHFENRAFDLEHVKEDLKKLTKKDVFEL